MLATVSRATNTHPWRLVLAILAVVLHGCGASGKPVGVDEANRSLSKKNEPEQAVTGHVVASLSERSLGPFSARRTGANGAGLAAWVTVAEGSGRRIIVVPLDARGAPRGGETVAANVSVDTTMLVVRPLRGKDPGFLIAWTSLTDRGKSLWSVAVGDDGLPRAKPVELTRTNEDIVWIDVVPTDHGGVCLWAEETRGSDANLLAAPINTDGHVRSAPTRVATGIVGWHALELGTGGLGVSTVTPPSASDPSAKPRPTTAEARLRDSRPGGALTFHRLDADAQKAGPPITITSKPIVSGDVEVVREGASRFVFAWTERTAEEPSISMAALDDQGKVEAPRKVIEANGGASLLAIAHGAAGTAVMFEAPARRRGETRRVHIARVSNALVLEQKGAVSIEVVGRGQPELAATATGFAVLATTADCEKDSPLCANAKAVATLIRTDASTAAVLQREPLNFLSDPATLGWGMACEAETCFTLAASPGPPGTPSRIRAVAIRPRNVKDASSPAATTKPAPSTASSKDGPRIVDITAVLSGESVHDLTTTRIGETVIVATLAKKDDVAPAAKSSTLTLSTRLVSDAGEPAAPQIITTKALAVGGVAIAAADKPDDGGAIAWVGRENGDPEVHVTRIDKRGRRTNDVQLTTAKGDASDVTITWAGNGFIVGWVDWRDGNGEVYATKVSLDLNRTAREERLTNAPGDASDLVALARGTDVWLAWADPRESPKDGIADVFVTAVRMKDAKRTFDEQRVLSTAAHSRTPHLAATSTGVSIAWIEEAPLGSETPTSSGYGAFFARLDPGNGKPTEKPMRLPLAGEGAATAVAIDATGTLRAVVARSRTDSISLDAVDLTMNPIATSSILALDGPPSLDVVLVLEGPILYFNDEGPKPADRRARRARIAWTK